MEKRNLFEELKEGLEAIRDNPDALTRHEMSEQTAAFSIANGNLPGRQDKNASKLGAGCSQADGVGTDAASCFGKGAGGRDTRALCIDLRACRQYHQSQAR